MHLKSRQYVFIAVILGLTLFNSVRLYRAHHKPPTPTMLHATTARGTSPLWAQYDAAAAARDASNEVFQPALGALTTALATPPTTTQPTDLAALNSCKLWLLFYRQEVLHPDDRSNWRTQTLEHSTFCAANHADFSQ